MTDVTDENIALDGDGEEATDEDGGAKKGFLSKKLIIIVAGALLLVGGGAGGAFYMGLFDASTSQQMDSAEPVVEKAPPVFFDLPDITVNLAGSGERSQYLRLEISLEVADADVLHGIKPFLPRVLDTFQVYLRELRIADLEGSAGIYRLKEELLRRINLAVYPAKIDDVLFRKLLVQ